MRPYLLLYVLLLASTGFSQSISKQIIGSIGGAFESTSNTINFTTGEVVVGAMTDEDGSFQLGNGYYPSLDVTTLSTETPELSLEVKLFPNPVTNTLFISHPEYNNFEVSITSMTGELLYSGLQQKEQGYNMQDYATGIFLISISPENSQQTNTYKIIKK